MCQIAAERGLAGEIVQIVDKPPEVLTVGEPFVTAVRYANGMHLKANCTYLGKRRLDIMLAGDTESVVLKLAPDELKDFVGSQTRQVIPERVRNEVWRRDQGRCVMCGSQERLEFDHIIPWSQGGSDTARNLQLLCERCNRGKGARI